MQAHASRHWFDIGDGFDELDCAVPRDRDERFRKLLIALAFWEGWSDSAGHGWYFYEPLTEQDWPILATEVVADLRADRDIQSQAVLAQFDSRLRKPSPSLWARLKKILHVG